MKGGHVEHLDIVFNMTALTSKLPNRWINAKHVCHTFLCSATSGTYWTKFVIYVYPHMQQFQQLSECLFYPVCQQNAHHNSSRMQRNNDIKYINSSEPHLSRSTQLLDNIHDTDIKTTRYGRQQRE